MSNDVTTSVCTVKFLNNGKNMSYNIQGSLAIQVKDGAVKFLLCPANAYLSPDKSCAVLYPVKTENQKNQATLLKLTDGYLELECDADMQCKDLLSQIALQNKAVGLTINEKNSITGFTYPIPRV